MPEDLLQQIVSRTLLFGKGKYNGNKRPKYDRLTISMSGADGTYEINGQDFEEAVRMVSKAPPRKWKRITPDAAMLGKIIQPILLQMQ